jgi:hypothetical protein
MKKNSNLFLLFVFINVSYGFSQRVAILDANTKRRIYELKLPHKADVIFENKDLAEESVVILKLTNDSIILKKKQFVLTLPNSDIYLIKPVNYGLKYTLKSLIGLYGAFWLALMVKDNNYKDIPPSIMLVITTMELTCFLSIININPKDKIYLQKVTIKNE